MAVQAVVGAALPPESFEPRNTPDTIVLGYLKMSRRLLTAVLTLHSRGFGDTTEGLVRTVLENAATVGWLLRAPEENAETLFRSFKREWRQLLEQGLAKVNSLEPGEREWVLSGPDASLPNMRKRAEAAGLGAQYVHYKALSMKIHGTLATASSGLREPSEDAANGYLAIGAASLAKLAALASDHLGWGSTQALVEAMTGVNRLLGDPG